MHLRQLLSFVPEMRPPLQEDRTVAVLSRLHVSAGLTLPEWATASRQEQQAKGLAIGSRTEPRHNFARSDDPSARGLGRLDCPKESV